jgi:hypothetical protein
VGSHFVLSDEMSTTVSTVTIGLKSERVAHNESYYLGDHSVFRWSSGLKHNCQEYQMGNKLIETRFPKPAAFAAYRMAFKSPCRPNTEDLTEVAFG